MVNTVQQLSDSFLLDMAKRAAARRPNPTPGYRLSRSEDVAPERATLSQLDETHHPLVRDAIAAARQWQETRWQQVKAYRERWNIPPDAVLDYYEPATSSLVLVATQATTTKSGRTIKDETRTGYGCGKTHIARAVLWSIFVSKEDGTPMAPVGAFFEANRLILELDANERGRYIETMLRNRPLVVIDDVGNKGTEQEIPHVSAPRQVSERQARYYSVINHCYENGIGVVITSNMTFGELRDHIGGRAYSRLTEMAPKGQWVDMTGVPDYRLKKGGRV